MVVQHGRERRYIMSVLRLNPNVWLVNALTTQCMVLENIQYFLRVVSLLFCAVHTDSGKFP
jgi:hypothetical protein